MWHYYITNLLILIKLILQVKNLQDKYKNKSSKHWTSDWSVGYLKWNTDASRIEEWQSTTNIMCRDNTRQIQYSKEKLIGDCPFLLVETLAIREATMASIQEKLSNVIIKNNLPIATHAIAGEIKVPSIISNIVADIVVLASANRNI